MDLSQVQVILRPRSVFEILDLSLDFIKRFWKGYLHIALVMIVPLSLINPLLTRGLSFDPSFSILLWIIELPIIHLPFIFYTSEALFNKEASSHQAIAKGLRAIPSLILQVLLRSALIFTFVGIPILSLFLRHYLEIRFLEGLKGPVYRTRQAFMRNHGFHGGTYLILLSLITLFCFWSIWVFFQSIYSIAMGIAYKELGALNIPLFVSLPFQLIPLLVFWPVVDFMVYIDARTRMEGWDLGLRLRFAGSAA